MPLLSLTPDVLQPVLSLLPIPDALALARVSHTAHALALPCILAHVTLGGAFHRPAHRPSPRAQLRAFCATFRVHPARVALIRSLELRRDAVRDERTYDVDPDTVAELADVLVHAHGLQRVTLWGLAQLVDACPAIVHALASCDRLETVVLGGDVPSLDLLRCAFPYARTLEFVEGGGACFKPVTSEAGIGSSSADVKAWSSLDYLSIGRPLVGSPFANPVYVRRLTLQDSIPHDDAVIDDALEFIKRARAVVLSVTVDADVPDDALVERLCDVCVGDGRDGYNGVRYLSLGLSGSRSLAMVEDWMTRVAPLLATLPLAALSLFSASAAAFPTPRPTPAASPLSSPPLGPTAALQADADVDALTLDSRMHTVYGTPRRPPPVLATLAGTLAGTLPALPYLALAPAGPARAEREWFDLARVPVEAKDKPRCLAEKEADRVQRRLEMLGRWD